MKLHYPYYITHGNASKDKEMFQRHCSLLLQNGMAGGPENIKDDSGPDVNVWLCISTALLLYCTQDENTQNAYALPAITLPSEIAPGNCRERHINKNISWAEGTLLSQLCQRCDCEMENMVSPLQKFTRTHWASVSQARLAPCDTRLPVVGSGSWISYTSFQRLL